MRSNSRDFGENDYKVSFSIDLESLNLRQNANLCWRYFFLMSNEIENEILAFWIVLACQGLDPHLNI